MAKLSLAKLERHLYAAADILRREGMDAATYKDLIFGMLFLKRCSDVFEAARFKDDWDALERELRRIIDVLRRGDTTDFPGLDAKKQVPFVRLMLDACLQHQQEDATKRDAVIHATLDAVERIRQEIRKVGFWKNQSLRELLTRQIVRDLDDSGVCPDGQARDVAQRLVALAKENYEGLTRDD